MNKYSQISILTGKRLRWRAFKNSCWDEGLRLYEKSTSSQMHSCGIFKVLQNIISKENYWSTASDF